MVYFVDPVTYIYIYIYIYTYVYKIKALFSLQYACKAMYVCVFMSAHPIGYNVTGSVKTLHVRMQIFIYKP